MRAVMTLAGLTGFLALLAGLCSVLVLVVTAGEAWREARQAHWPEASATIESCSVELVYFDGPNSDDPTWWLECKIGFRAASDSIRARLYSGHRSNPAQGYPDPMNQWANDHPPGSVIEIRYNPANPQQAVAATDYLPNGEPRTLGNLKLLATLLAAFGAGLLTTRLLQRRRAAA